MMRRVGRSRIRINRRGAVLKAFPRHALID